MDRIEAIITYFAIALIVVTIATIAITALLLRKDIHKLTIVSLVELGLYALTFTSGKGQIAEIVLRATGVEVSAQYSGAGPEPYEVAIILLFVGSLCVLALREYRLHSKP